MFIEVRYGKCPMVKGLSLTREFKLTNCNPRVKKKRTPRAPRVPLVQYEFLPPAQPTQKKESKKKQPALC